MNRNSCLFHNASQTKSFLEIYQIFFTHLCHQGLCKCINSGHVKHLIYTHYQALNYINVFPNGAVGGIRNAFLSHLSFCVMYHWALVPFLQLKWQENQVLRDIAEEHTSSHSVNVYLFFQSLSRLTRVAPTIFQAVIDTCGPAAILEGIRGAGSQVQQHLLTVVATALLNSRTQKHHITHYRVCAAFHTCLTTLTSHCIRCTS